MKNLDELFNQVKFSTILTTGRTGSDYLQGCLENVPGVLTFSDKFFYYYFCDNIKLNNFEEISPLRILELFFSRNNHPSNELIETPLVRNELKNKNFNIDMTKFRENFIRICGKGNLNRQKFLFALYLAYHITLDRDTNDIRIMVHHSHHPNETKRFLQDFKNSRLLVTIRDPRANLKSGIVNWIKYDKKMDNQNHFYFYIMRIREDLKFAQKQINEKFFVKLEEARNLNTKKKLSEFLGIEFSPEMNECTYAGKIWTGDRLSQFSSAEGNFMESVVNNQWQNFFSKKDKLILDFIYKDYRSFGYRINKTNWIKAFFIFFLIPLPFVFDKKIFSLNYYLDKRTPVKEKILEISFYLRRIFYFYKLLFKLG